MENNEDKVWEKFYGKKVSTKEINITGFDKPVMFDIYDGYAVCKDHDGHRFDIAYPEMKIIKDSTEMSDAIIDYLDGINNKDQITEEHSLMCFGTLYIDGVKVESI